MIRPASSAIVELHGEKSGLELVDLGEPSLLCLKLMARVTAFALA